MPFDETPGTQEYPSGCCLYRVYERGYMQTFYKNRCDECLEWAEMTKGEHWGRAPQILFGALEDRNFVYLCR